MASLYQTFDQRLRDKPVELMTDASCAMIVHGIGQLLGVGIAPATLEEFLNSSLKVTVEQIEKMREMGLAPSLKKG